MYFSKKTRAGYQSRLDQRKGDHPCRSNKWLWTWTKSGDGRRVSRGISRMDEPGNNDSERASSVWWGRLCRWWGCGKHWRVKGVSHKEVWGLNSSRYVVSGWGGGSGMLEAEWEAIGLGGSYLLQPATHGFSSRGQNSWQHWSESQFRALSAETLAKR